MITFQFLYELSGARAAQYAPFISTAPFVYHPSESPKTQARAREREKKASTMTRSRSSTTSALKIEIYDSRFALSVMNYDSPGLLALPICNCSLFPRFALLFFGRKQPEVRLRKRSKNNFFSSPLNRLSTHIYRHFSTRRRRLHDSF